MAIMLTQVLFALPSQTREASFAAQPRIFNLFPRLSPRDFRMNRLILYVSNIPFCLGIFQSAAFFMKEFFLTYNSANYKDS